jgi:hypothetical protein
VTDPNDDIIDAEIHNDEREESSNVYSDKNVGSFDDEISLNRPQKGLKSRRVLVGVLAVAVLAGGFFAVNKFRGGSDLEKIQGKIAMSASELRDVVVARKLTVYWSGPVEGDKYSLIATTPNVAYVRYLPAGVGPTDTKTLSRAIGTYVQKDSFSITQKAGQNTGNVGFINADGNAVFYVKVRPTNVYIGVPKLNLQIEVFDPGVDQALGLALIKNQVRRIV